MYYARYMFDDGFVGFKTKKERDDWVNEESYLARIPVEEDELVGKFDAGYEPHTDENGLMWFDPPETYIDEDGLVWYPIDL